MKTFLRFLLLFTMLSTYSVVAQNWQLQNSNFPNNIMASNFSAVSDLVCWAGGVTIGSQTPYPGYIQTIDGGNTWVCDSIPSIPDGLISQVFAIDADTAYMAVYVLTYSNSKGIYKTKDGGTTWTKQNAYLTSIYGPGCIHFFDAINGVVIGDPLLETYTTTNGGQTWNPVSMPQALADEYTWVGGTCITGYGNSVWFCSTKRIFHSTDRGKTWTASPYGSQYDFWFPCVAFQNEDIGIYSLANYNSQTHIYRKTTDGGVTWGSLSNAVLDNINPSCIIHIPLTSATYLVSGGYQTGMRGLAATYDAGENWDLIDTVGCMGIGFSSAESGWGTPYPTYQVQKYIGDPITDVIKVEGKAFNSYLLEQNWPNPFNPTTTIGFGLQNESNVKITVLNVIGEEVAVILNEEKEPGYHYVEFNAANLPSGVYFYRIQAGNFVQTKKMILLK